MLIFRGVFVVYMIGVGGGVGVYRVLFCKFKREFEIS